MIKYVVECELPSGEKFVKRMFKKKPAAIQYAEELSVKNKRWVVRVFSKNISVTPVKKF